MTTFLIFQNLGMSELLIILVIVLLLFGAKKIPELMRGLGRGVREFKDAQREISREIEQEAAKQPPAQQKPLE